MLPRLILTGVLATLVAQGAAQAASVNDYVAACTGDTDRHLSAQICGCIGNKAKSQLSDTGFDFFVAATAKDQTRSSMLYRKLSPDEIMTATLISMRGPGECEQELGGAKEPAEQAPATSDGTI